VIGVSGNFVIVYPVPTGNKEVISGIVITPNNCISKQSTKIYAKLGRFCLPDLINIDNLDL